MPGSATINHEQVLTCPPDHQPERRQPKSLNGTPIVNKYANACICTYNMIRLTVPPPLTDHARPGTRPGVPRLRGTNQS